MADAVQFRLERTVAELDDLARLKLFDEEEIRNIEKKRSKFENNLKRPRPLKQDFLDYIEYETHLDALRRLRKKTSPSLLPEKTIGKKRKKKKSVSDFSMVRRILELYEMAVSRFKGDIHLWFRYLEFCRTRKNGRMKRALAQVIRFHPKVAGVWIYAAAWEFDQNLNVAAARALMQSGLRMCPASEDLWVEYLRMELTYLNKLRARRIALGEDEGALAVKRTDKSEDQWRNENQELFLSLSKDEGGYDVVDDQNGDTQKGKELFPEKSSVILDAIYSGAVDAIPSSFSLRRRFFEILDSIELSQSEEIWQKVLVDMRRDFSKDPAYWDWLARLEISDLNDARMDEQTRRFEVQKATKVYEEALNVLPSEALFNLYAKFLLDIIALSRMETQSCESSGEMSFYVSQLLEVYEKAETLGCLSEEIATKHTELILELGRLDEARNLAEKFCSWKLSSSVQLLLLRISIELRCSTNHNLSMGNADVDSIFRLLCNALRKADVSEAEKLWLMALRYFANQKNYFQELLEIAFVSLAKNSCKESGFSPSSAIINFVLQKEGIKQARDIYKRFLASPQPGVAAYWTCIELESNLAFVGAKDCLARARKLYESALASYDQDSTLWRGYYSLEIKLGTAESASAVQWRAQKTLKDGSALTTLPNW